jgi:hypothetical protein
MNHNPTPQDIFTVVEAFFKPPSTRKYNHYSTWDAITENWPYYIAATKQHLRGKNCIYLASPIPAACPLPSMP